MIKCVIYDLDGTILDTEKMNFIPLQRLIKEELLIDIPYEDLLKYRSNAGLKTIEELGFKDIEKSYAKWVKYVNEYEEGARLYDGFEKIIKTLDKAGIIQGIASSKMRNQYEIDFYKTGLREFMKCEVLAEDTKEHKPNPAPLIKALSILDILPDESIYVGDTLADYKAAKEAGMKFAFASWGGTVDERIKPDFHLDNPNDLLNIIDE